MTYRVIITEKITEKPLSRGYLENLVASTDFEGVRNAGQIVHGHNLSRFRRSLAVWQTMLRMCEL